MGRFFHVFAVVVIGGVIAFGIDPNANIPNHLLKASSAFSQEERVNDPDTNASLHVDLFLDIAAYPDSVAPGDSIIYAIRYLNRGTETAHDVTILNYAPNHPDSFYTTLIGVEPASADTDATADGKLKRLMWLIPNLAPLEEGTIICTLRVDPMLDESKSLSDCVIISSSDFGPSEECATVHAFHAPILGIKKDVSPDSSFPKDTVEWTISYWNSGNKDAEDVIIKDILPVGMTFLSSHPDPDRMSGDALVWNVGTVREGASGNSILILARVDSIKVRPPSTVMCDTVFIVLDELVTDTAWACLTVLPLPDLVPTIDPCVGTPSPGFPLLITATVRNEGGTVEDTFVVAFHVDDLRSAPIDLDTVPPPLDDGESVSVSGTWARADSGTHVFCVVADHTKDIVEYREDNNSDCADTCWIGVESLMVTVNQVTISQQDTVKPKNDGEKTGGFPEPVLTFVTVTDQNRHHITGLADTLSWLERHDHANCRDLVGDIWHPVKEYHEEDPSRPALQEVPHLQVTEMREVLDAGISVAFVMDYSGSMGSTDRANAEAAARAFVDMMTQRDRAAIVKFDDDVDVVQNFTSDTDALYNAIHLSGWGGWTALYDAIHQGITLTINESGRKAVIAYTDGWENRSSRSRSRLIAYAQRHGVPVFTIGIGTGTDVDEHSLKKIAEETGGIYVNAPTSAEMEYIYLLLSEMIRNYYVLAHYTTDDEPNCTARIVDVTVNYAGLSGMDTGKYEALCEDCDMTVWKESVVDSVFYADGETLKYVFPGEVYPYSITFGNIGSEVCNNVMLVDAFPEAVTVSDFSTPPDDSSETTLVWFSAQMTPGERRAITFYATVKDPMPPGWTRLVDCVVISSDEDVDTTNNTHCDIVYAPPSRCPEIEVSPAEINPGDSVEVRVRTHALVKRGMWDVGVSFADGTEDWTYADELVRRTDLWPDQWYVIAPEFGDTRLRTDADEEVFSVMLSTTDVHGLTCVTDTFFVAKGECGLSVDKNTFRPDNGQTVKVDFKIRRNRTAKVSVYTVSAGLVRVLADGYYYGGWNSETWDGRNVDGGVVASGVYVITLESGECKIWSKVIVLR